MNDGPTSLSGLRTYARRRLAARRYPTDRHTFTVFQCRACDERALTLTIEHHTGSKRRDFKGAIYARCSACGDERRIFRFTGPHREVLRRESPICTCGHPEFLVVMLERFEADDGMPGFFDEGVILGQCSRCGRRQTFVYTD
jgi:hypothetical protein